LNWLQNQFIFRQLQLVIAKKNYHIIITHDANNAFPTIAKSSSSAHDVDLPGQKLTKHLTLKLLFQENENLTTMLMNHKNVYDYFQLYQKDVPTDMDAVLEFILCDENTNFILDNRNSVISMTIF